jgi:hypothetical protein
MGLIEDMMRSTCRLPGPTRPGASVHCSLLRVTFSQSTAQTYGYDNMDTPGDVTDDHVSVKIKATTYIHVKIDGGTSTDVEFVCDNTSVAQPGAAPAGAEFDLPVNGQDPGATVLHARQKTSHTECTSININTYKEKQVTAAVMKVYDSRTTGTNLRFPHLDVSSIPTLINPKYKDAVAVLSLTDQSSGGGAFDIPYDNDRNGKLTWDIAANGGSEYNAITSQFTVAGQKVIIVRDMVSVYFLAAAAAKDATSITINSSDSFLTVGQSYPLGTGTTRETVTIQSKSGSTLTLAGKLSNNHSNGETLEFPAGGWGGNPIVIIEGTLAEDILKWTFGHELGHAVLGLADVSATESIMNYSQGWTDHRLRYKPLPKKYKAGTENQWETISR